MTLVDTSVWIDHLHRSDEELVRRLHDGRVVCHPFVVGELACGVLRDREAMLAFLSNLPTVAKADDDELLLFIDSHRLMGKGMGLVDVHLLASCLLSGVNLRTHDGNLARAAVTLGCAAKWPAT